MSLTALARRFLTFLTLKTSRPAPFKLPNCYSKIGISALGTNKATLNIKDFKMPMDDDDVRVVKLRGLPWSATKDDILDFFNDCKAYKGQEGVHLVLNPNGKATGEAFVEVPPDDDIEVFLRKDKKSMGHRYVEVFKVKRSEMEWAVRKKDAEGDSRDSDGSNEDTEGCECYVRLRGLPFECSKEDIQQFFQGLEMTSNGIQLMVDNLGRSSGEAYVQFETKEQAEKALSQDRQNIGHRYIETFRVGPAEMKNMQSAMTRSSGGRGLSYHDRPSPYERHSQRDSRYGGSSRAGSSRQPYQSSRNRGYDDYGRDRGSWGRSEYNDRRSNRNSISSSEKNCVLMRGLPFKADEHDIRRFFEPLSPTAVDIIFDSSGRPSGTAKVLFSNGDDVTRAMGKHKERMEHRYIELFLHNV